MRVHEFERLVIDLLEKDDHPEIVAVQGLAEDQADTKHSRVRVDFASGAKATMMVREITGPNIPRHAPFQLPKEAL
jgi:hypothetical protein